MGLLEIAKIQSTQYPNKIEEYISDDRLKQIVLNKTAPKTRDEQEIAGYRDVLNTIHSSYEYISIVLSMILQLHRDLYKFSGINYRGKYKISDNIIAEADSNGKEYVRFEPVLAWFTNDSVKNLCDSFQGEMNKNKIDILLLKLMFILDFFMYSSI